MVTRVIAYLRVSSDEQTEKYGLDDQRESIRDYCAKNGLTIAATYSDDITGTIPLGERPEGRKALALLKVGKAKGIVFAKVNRISRNFADLLVTIRDLTKAGYQIHSTDVGKIQDETDVGMIFSAWMGHKDRQDIIRRTAAGRKNKAKRGVWVGTGGAWGVPYGYRVIGVGKDAKIVIDKQRAHTVESIYKQYAIEGVPTRRIAETLNKKGVSPARSKQWTKGMVWNILAKDWYLGRVKYGEIAFIDPSLAIVTPELWHKAANRRAENHKHAPKNFGVDYLLSRGRLMCLCGSSTCGVSSGGGKYRAYLCWKHTEFNEGDQRRCDLGRLRQGDVEASALYWLMGLALYKDKMGRVIREMEEKARRELEPLKQRRDSTNEMIGDTSTQITRLIRRSADEPDDNIAQSYQAELHRLSDLSKGLSDQLSEVESQIADYGLWAEGGVTPEQLQAELQEAWDFPPLPDGTFGEGMYSELRFDKMNRAKMRKIIERYDLRAEVVRERGEVQLRVSCALQPKGQTIGIINSKITVGMATDDLRKLTTGT